MQKNNFKKVLTRCICIILGLVFISNLFTLTHAQRDIQLETIAKENYYVITSHGNLIGWGSNWDGEIGPRILPWYPYPLRHRIISDAIEVHSNGENCTMALDSSGTLWGWGKQEELLLQKETPILNNPKRVMDYVVDFDVGRKHVIAVKADGTMWAWGRNESHQLGTNNVSTDEWTNPFCLMENINQVYVYGDISFAITTSNDLYAWGPFSIQQNGTIKAANEPVLVCRQVKDIAHTGINSKYQVLKTNGDLYIVDILKEYTSGTKYLGLWEYSFENGILSLFDGGIIAEGHAMWKWSEEKQVLSLYNTMESAAYATSGDLYVDTEGNIYVSSYDKTTIKPLSSVDTTARNCVVSALLLALILCSRRLHIVRSEKGAG